MVGPPTIIQQPGALDEAVAAFMRSLVTARQLSTQKQQLLLEQQRTAAQVNLEGAEAKKAKADADRLEQEIENTTNMEHGNAAAAGFINLPPEQVGQALASLPEEQRGHAMKFYLDQRGTLAELQKNQGLAQQIQAETVRLNRENQNALAIGHTVASYQGKPMTVDNLQRMLAEVAAIDPTKAASIAQAVGPTVEGDWHGMQLNNGQLVLYEGKRGIVRDTGINGGARSLNTASGREIQLAAVQAVDALANMETILKRDPNADILPVATSVARGAQGLPFVGRALSGAAEPIAQRAMTPNQQQFQRYADQFLHNYGSLLPRGQRSMVILNNLRQSYVPTSGQDPAARTAARKSRQQLLPLIRALATGKGDLTALPGFTDAAASPNEPAVPTGPNYGDYMGGPPQ